ncbi:MAG: alpha-amylase family glycosyl hydrolase, partial [Polyangiaceae bacterium]
MTSKIHGENVERRFAVGAELVKGGVHFRIWAPEHTKVAVVIEGGAEIPLRSEGAGYFAGLAAKAGVGSLYRVRLGDRTELYADPASRFQPEGPHGPSQVVDPDSFAWSHPWRGAGEKGQIIYELHVGTFTQEGTWASAMRELPHLATLGVTLLEVMPVHEFPGTFGWGYDGVNLFAPTRLYGTPDDFRAFVDEAHRLGLGVILDVVYNHLG